MNILLTGMTGFIGSHVARCLLRDEHRVTALTRPGSNPARITDLSSRITWIQSDLLTSQPILPVDRMTAPFDVCIHLAWHVEPGVYLESPLNAGYLQASRRLAVELVSIGCRRLIVAGTCFEYQHDRSSPLSESDPTGPVSTYARAKLELLDSLREIPDLQVTWLRFFYLYGPYEHPRRLVPAVINAIRQSKPATITSARFIRDYIHVADAADAVSRLVLHPLIGPVNIGSGNPVSVGQIATTIAELMGRPDLIQISDKSPPASDPPHVLADITRLRNSTGWTPSWNLRDGLQHTINWWMTQPVRVLNGQPITPPPPATTPDR